MPATNDEAVPSHWWERKTSNRWFNQATGKVELPTTLGPHKGNYVLRLEEMQQYEQTLQAMRDSIEREHTKVRIACKALERGHHQSFIVDHPYPVTLTRLLQFMLDIGKCKLGMLKFMLPVAQRAVAVSETSDKETSNEA